MRDNTLFLIVFMYLFLTFKIRRQQCETVEKEFDLNLIIIIYYLPNVSSMIFFSESKSINLVEFYS